MKNIAELIEAAGGPAKFSRAFSIPIRTVEEWKAGRRNPPPWVVKLIERAVK